MKKILSIIIAFFIVLILVFIGKLYIQNKIILNKDKLIYANLVERNGLDFLMDEILDEKSILVLGSSELSSHDNIAYPNYLYNGGNADYRIVPVGRGNNQSLFHAISVSALFNNIKNNKVVLIISPQWFTKVNTTSQIFSSRFSESTYVEFLKNNKITAENKKKIAKRVVELLNDDPLQQDRVKEMNSLYLEHNINPVNYIKYEIYNSFMNLKSSYEFSKIMGNYYLTKTRSDEKIKVSDINYDELMNEAIKAGKNECTNNDFGIYDDYFNKYVKDVLDSEKNRQINDTYTDSPEYGDLRMFLEVCKDLKLDVMLVSIPVNGRWYDYTGFSKEDRQKYYENIRNISKEYNTKIADFSDKEYEIYFLRDIMHIGWKGWVYVDEAIYNFYQE